MELSLTPLHCHGILCRRDWPEQVGTELAGNMYWPKYLNTKTFLFGHIPNWSQHIYVGYWPRDKSTLHLIWIVMIYLWSDVFLAFHWHYHGDIVHVLILRWYWYQYIYCNTHVHVNTSGIVLVLELVSCIVMYYIEDIFGMPLSW